jgi:hypothetical protein
MGQDKRYQPTTVPSYLEIQGSRVRRTSKAVQLTATQITGMFTTPVAVIPAPDSNTGIVIEAMQFEMIPGSTAFTLGGTVNPVYHGQSTNLLASTLPATVVNAAANSAATLTSFDASSAANGITVPVGVGVDVTSSAAFATGNGTMWLFVKYLLVRMA